MTNTIHVGISTCPNDTFSFHALLAEEIQIDGLRLRFELTDVEELNERFLAGEFDVAKLSFHAALLCAADLWVLPTGSALGSGVGPLLLAAKNSPTEPRRVLCPGRYTTAALLYALFHADEGVVEHCVFSDIMPRLKTGEVDRGVCIHEGRFTWETQGLDLIEDLGERWERETGALLPLGGIVARRTLDASCARSIATAIGSSIDWGRAHPEHALMSMRAHAQELSDDVLNSHVDLYVNEHTRQLGPTGLAALEALSAIARTHKLIPQDSPALELLP
ncbi:MAG: 1,4-dihydroxy-6-naphthoate synthase [Planctomycetota bacterium]